MSAAARDLPRWLFVSYGGGHVRALLPVAQRVRDLGIADPVYLALTTAGPVVRAAGIPVLGLRDFLDPGDAATRAIGERLVGDLAVQAADREESIAYLGLSYRDLEARLGVEQAARAYSDFGRQAFLPLGVLDRVLDRIAPELVIATNSPRAERAAIEAARARGIRAACLLDLFGLWERAVLVRPDYADAVCVLNEEVRRSLVDSGRPAAHVHVTGNPAFDSVNDPAVIAAGRTLREGAGWENLHVFLSASSPEPQAVQGNPAQGDTQWPRKIEAALIEAVKANAGTALWVRRHPSEAPADEIAALKHPRIRVAGTDVALHACIHASDEAMVTVSTVGLEAHLAGKRVTQVRGSILDHLSPYLEMGVADRELRLDQVAGAIAEAALRSAQEEVQAAKPDITAADKVVAVLQALTGRGHG